MNEVVGRVHATQGVLEVAGAKRVSLHDLTAGPVSVLEMGRMAGKTANPVALVKKTWNETATDIAGGTRHEHLLDRGSHETPLGLLRIA